MIAKSQNTSIMQVSLQSFSIFLVSSVFENSVEVLRILNLLHWILKRLLNRFANFFAPVDFIIEGIYFLLSHHLVVDHTNMILQSIKIKINLLNME